MKLPRDAIIATAKLTKYLLVWRDADDKSQFLAQAGYGQDNTAAIGSGFEKPDFAA